MKLLGGKEKKKKTKDKINAYLTYLEITSIVLVHFNVENDDYQQDSRVLYTFVPNKSIGQLLEIWPKKFELCFPDQNSKPLEMQDKISIALAINWCATYKMIYSIQPRDQVFVKDRKFRLVLTM